MMPAAYTNKPVYTAPIYTAPIYTAPASASQLSPSQVTAWLDCSARWYFKYALGLPEPKTAALLIGEAFHHAIAATLRHKIEHGAAPDLDAAIGAFDQAWRIGLDSTELAADDNADELAGTGRKLVQVYLRDAVPMINAAAIEMPVHGKIGGVPVVGFVDILTTDGHIIDLKTASKKPSGLNPSHCLQLTTYAMLSDQTLEGSHTQTRIDTVTKTKSPALEIQTVPITAARRRYAEIIYPLAQEGMRDGLIVPHRNSFLCSQKHCAHWQACEAEFGGEVKP